jgi:AraC-like DNA-binding protein
VNILVGGCKGKLSRRELVPHGSQTITDRCVFVFGKNPCAPDCIRRDELVAGVSGSDSDGDRIETANRLLESALQTPAQNEGRLKLLLDATNGGRCKAADIARSLAMSDRSFSRLWKEIVGIEPRRFVQIMRFHNALTMIAEGDELAAVAAACGFSDQPHMARQIKAISGLPPSSLRKRLGDRAYRALYESRPGAPWLGRKKP